MTTEKQVGVWTSQVSIPEIYEQIAEADIQDPSSLVLRPSGDSILLVETVSIPDEGLEKLVHDLESPSALRTVTVYNLEKLTALGKLKWTIHSGNTESANAELPGVDLHLSKDQETGFYILKMVAERGKANIAIMEDKTTVGIALTQLVRTVFEKQVSDENVIHNLISSEVLSIEK